MSFFVAKYRCAGCGEHDFKVRWRRSSEDVVDWMEVAVRPALSAAHMVQSPNCRAKQCDLLIPMDNTAPGVGMRPVFH